MSSSSSHDHNWFFCTAEGLDRRTKRTREALMSAFLDLLKEKPLNAITVTELTDAANVNRATFYTHYQDIFALYEQLQSALCQTCRAMVDAHSNELVQGNYLGLIGDIYQFIDENDRVFSILFSDRNDSSFFTSILEVVREACVRNVGVIDSVSKRMTDLGYEGAKAKKACETVCRYQFDYIAGGVVSILRGWMLGGRKESVQTMSYLTSDCIKNMNPYGDYRNVIGAAKRMLENQ